MQLRVGLNDWMLLFITNSILFVLFLANNNEHCIDAFSIVQTRPNQIISPPTITLRSWSKCSTTSRKRCLPLLNLSEESEPPPEESQNYVHIEAIASAGLAEEELPFILSAASEALSENFGIEFRSNNGIINTNPAVPKSVPGATGRVLLLSLNNVANDWEENDDRLDPFKNVISQQIDALVGYQIEQPVLVSIRPNYNISESAGGEDALSMLNFLSTMVNNEAMMYGLCTPMVSDSVNSTDSGVINEDQILSSVPSTHVEIDGAMVPNPYTKDESWDTSTVLIFDDFVDHSLRERLLDVVNKRDDNYDWDDKIKGPDPKRWERGGLMDTFGDEEDKPTCWGLTEEATNELCFEQHPAIAEVEKKLSALFARNFVVTRLPEAVFGSCVSPLTANAPTFGDSFSYHIDADPNQMPPSPWTDVFGRYFNRVDGKPRFLSVLLYLNDDWNDELGAPTQFYDPPTEEVYQVFPRPGRCVMMDQDVTHTVVAPNEIAGVLPRYSLVWKLILHPKEEKQSMKLPSSKSPVRIGSANNIQ